MFKMIWSFSFRGNANFRAIFICAVLLYNQSVTAPRTLSLQPSRPTINSQMNISCAVSGGINGTDVIFYPTNKLGQCTMAFNTGCVIDPACPYTASCDVSGSQFTLTIDSVPDTWHGINISCDASFGGDNSNTVSLFIQVPVTNVTMQNRSTVNVTESENVNLTCTTGTCRPAANISWYKDNSSISSNIVHRQNTERDKFITTSTLTLRGNRQDQNKTIHCEASNIPGYPSETSAGSLVNVWYAPTGVPSISPTGNGTYNESNTLTLTCTLTEDGNPPAVWSWICNNQPMSQGQITTIQKGSRLTFTANKDRNGHQCHCRATSPIASYNQTSPAVTLNIQYAPSGLPSISPTGIMTYNESNTVTFTCTLTEDGNPTAVWSWICNNQPMPQGQITTIQNGSRLTFSATNDRNGHQCYCRATSPIASYSQASNIVTLNIQYAPTGVPSISPSGNGTYNENNTVTLTCSLTEDGNPAAMWSWMCNNQPMSQGQITTIQNGSRLTFTATKDRNGHQYHCRATSHIASYSQASTTVTLNILYAAKIQNITINGGSGDRVVENTSLSVYCKVDSNPAATTQIINMDNGTTFQTQNGMWNISNSDCLDTATYKCEASNGHGIPSTKSFNISVLCSPRPDTRVSLPNRYDIPSGGILTLSAQFIAYPLPIQEDIKWIFRFNETDVNSTIVNNGKDINITKTDLDKNVCNINLTKRFQVSRSDFGEYVAEVKNNLGRGEIVYNVFPAGPPDPPRNLSLNCESPVKVIVSWISSFNGGAEQSFYVQYNIYNSTNIQVYPVEKKDAEEDKLMSHEITALKGNTVYSFAVFSNNSHGNNTPTDTVSCKVLGIKRTDDTGDNSSLIGAAAGVGAGIVLIIVIVVGILLYRRYTFTSNKDNSEGKGNSVLKADDSDEDDGLKPNPLYGSSPPAIPLDPRPSSSEYASVVKPRKEKTNSQDSPPIYSEVQKPKSKQKQKDKKKGHSKTKEDGMVYENMDDMDKTGFVNEGADKEKITGGTDGSGERGYRNQDGLLYLHVAFDNNRPQGRPIIHGDEKTGYAMIELQGVNNDGTSAVKGAEDGNAVG